MVIMFSFIVIVQVMNDAVNPLFCLLILEGLADSQGRVWRRHPSQLYCIEVTQEQCVSVINLF